MWPIPRVSLTISTVLVALLIMFCPASCVAYFMFRRCCETASIFAVNPDCLKSSFLLHAPDVCLLLALFWQVNMFCASLADTIYVFGGWWNRNWIFAAQMEVAGVDYFPLYSSIFQPITPSIHRSYLTTIIFRLQSAWNPSKTSPNWWHLYKTWIIPSIFGGMLRCEAAWSIAWKSPVAWPWRGAMPWLGAGMGVLERRWSFCRFFSFFFPERKMAFEIFL